MANVPIVRQVAWLSLIPQLIFMGALMYMYHLLKFRAPFFFGALTYLILSFGLRSLLIGDHMKGIILVKQQKFEDAIPLFEKSVEFFSKNAWIDKFRFLTLLSSSKMTYKEMGLCNIAFCYSQTGNGQKAKAYYEQALKEFPENGLAIAGLKMIDSFAQIAQDEKRK